MSQTAKPSATLRDGFGRRVDYLRISLTERCDLRCVYCQPWAPETFPTTDVLSSDDVVAIAAAALKLGMRRIRLTGGEPLLREDLEEIVARLRGLDGLQDLSLTTNGQALSLRAAGLAAAGLMRVNVSLDSLDPETYAAVTGGGDLAAVRRGLEAALAAGLSPVKVNVVLSRASCCNGSALGSFVELIKREPIHVRLIEAMPTCSRGARVPIGGFLPAQQVLDELLAGEQVTSVAGPAGGGPARYYRLDGSAGTMGIIAPLSEPFCSHCNRLRVSARGEIRPCLFSLTALPLTAALKSPNPTDDIMDLLRQAAMRKPWCYRDIAARDGIPEMRVIGG